jgi:hypothetical protein
VIIDVLHLAPTNTPVTLIVIDCNEQSAVRRHQFSDILKSLPHASRYGVARPRNQQRTGPSDEQVGFVQNGSLGDRPLRIFGKYPRFSSWAHRTEFGS